MAIKEKSSHCLKQQLGLKVDKFGLIRCHERFLNTDITEDVNYLKLHPLQEHVTKLLIIEVYLRLIHVGGAHMLAQIHEEYWIPHGRVEVRSVLLKCIVCQKQEHLCLLGRERASFPLFFISVCWLGLHGTNVCEA